MGSVLVVVFIHDLVNEPVPVHMEKFVRRFLQKCKMQGSIGKYSAMMEFYCGVHSTVRSTNVKKHIMGMYTVYNMPN